MDAAIIVREALAAGVRLYLDDGRLAFKSRPGQFTPSLRELVREHREEITEWLARRNRSQLIVAQKKTRYPLTYAQRRLHFLTQLGDGSSHYNLRVALRLDGALDRAALAAALTALVERHAILRTTYVEEGAQVFQQINPATAATIELTNWQWLNAPAQQAALQELIAMEAHRRFDLAHGGALSVQLVLLSPSSHALLLTVHHIATDGMSMAILTREFMALYDAFRQGRSDPLPALPFQYGDYAAWQQETLDETALEDRLTYWREALAGVPTVHRLPLDKSRPTQPDYVGEVVEQRLDGTLRIALEKLAQRHGCTLFLVVKALYAVLLGKYGDSRDVVIGVPAAGREVTGTAALAGFFANTLVFRHMLDWTEGFASLLKAHKAQAAAVFQHQDVPFELLVEALRVERSLSHQPLIQVFLAFQNYGQDALVLDGLTVTPLNGNTHNVRFDLELTVQLPDEGLHLQWSYATALFDASTIARLATGFEMLARAVVADEDRQLSTLEVLSEVDRQQLATWNRTERTYAGEALPAWIAAQAARTPKATALDDGTRQMDYQALERRANGLAQALRARGVGTGSLVGIYLPRSVDMVVALLGILRSGAAYVPLDPGYPPARLAYVVEDSGLRMVVTCETLREGAASLSPIALDMLLVEAVGESEAAPADAVDMDEIAYVIYTSGSTGRPKGVMVEHRQLANFRHAIAECLGLDGGVWLAVTAYSFDISILELLCPLSLGFTVVIGDHQRHADEGYAFASLMQRHGVTHLQCTPSLLRMYMELPAFCEALAELEVLMVGGEACPVPLVERLAGHTQARVMNLYGPTETTIWSSSARLDGASRVSIGRPIGNTRFHVVDESLRPVPVGVQGELLIGGEGVARGYLGRDDLTAERFITWQDGDGRIERVYRTGDLVRWQSDGQLTYLGRRDAQVKIRGHRVELGEIETQLAMLADVREAAVALHDISGDPQLVAYLVADAAVADTDTWVQTCKIELARELASYMMPSAWVVLERLPMTPNGKVDRQTLPVPTVTEDVVEPTTETEVRVRAIWQGILGRADVGVRNNFFVMGGHSLLATELIVGLNETFGAGLRLADVFLHQTIAEQAWLIDATIAGRTSEHASRIIVAQKKTRYPLTYAQRRLHFLTQLGDGSSHYNLRVALRLDGALDRAALAAALTALVERHAILRTTYVEEGAQVFQQINPATAATIELTNWQWLNAPAQQAALQELIAMEAHRRFDLAHGGALSVQLVLLSPSSHALLLTVHHIATDGMSMAILTREFMALYDAFRQGRSDPLPALPFQYGDYAAWQQETLDETALEDRLTYWREALAGVPTVHRLPLDKSRPTQPDYVGEVVEQRLDGTLRIALEKLAQRHGCTLFLVVKALYAVLLGKYGDSRDVVIGVPAAGREVTGTAALAGFFANTLVFRHMLDWTEGFASLLKAHKAQAAAVFQHQDVPFELLVEALRVERSLSHQPLIQVFLAFQNYGQDALVLDGLTVTPLNGNTHNVRFDLELTVQLPDEGLHLQWSYATALFDASTIARLATGFEMLARAVVADEDRQLSTLEVLSEVDRQQLATWNRTERTYAGEALPAWIAAQAARTPKATALDDGTRQMDYQALERRANGLAQALRARGVGTGSLVGIYLPRSVDMVVALLGILRSGAAYVPLDPGYPPARLAYVVEDSGLRMVVTCETLREGAASLSPIALDMLLVEAVGESEAAPADAVDMDEIAYVIYTSGSTGRPKGVMVEHRQLANFRHAIAECLGLDGGVWLAVTAYSFDISILELLCPLSLGFTVVIGDHQRHADEGYAFASLMQRHGVTHLQCTPSLLRMYMELPAFCEALAELEVLMVGGEACPVPLVERLAGHTQARVMNLYGPTETTIWSSSARLDGASRVSIGRPIGNTRFHVVDESLRPVPVGVQGELLIGGEGVARGYLGRDDLTAERFITWQDGDGRIERVYRTGDLVRWQSDGQLTYLGRRDAQVKIRGHRVELGEIETQLAMLADVREAAVALHDISGDPQLVAYLVADAAVADTDTWVQTCKIELARELASYMMPSAWVVLERLPMTPNGKVDRQVLPVPGARDFHRDVHVPATTPLESQLEAVWNELLHREGIGVAVGFFDAGGHSLLATRLVSRVREVFGVELSLKDVFEQQTIRDQALLIAARPAAAVKRIPVANRPDVLPLSFAQQRMWFVHGEEQANSAYNIVAALSLTGDLDLAALRDGIDTIVTRHEVLRTTYHADARGLWQRIHPACSLSIGKEDLSAMPEDARRVALERLMAQEGAKAFDLANDGMLRTTVVTLAPREHILMLTVHHIAADGWSMDVLVEEFAALYGAWVAGHDAVLPALPVQYADFALWQREQAESLAEGLAYWTEQLAASPGLTTLPPDRPRPARVASAGANYRSELSASVLDKAKALCRRHDVTLFMLLESVLALLLGRYSGQHDLVIGTPVAGRLHREVEPLVGCFVNNLALRTRLTTTMSFAELLEATRATVVAGYEWQDVPFDRVVEGLQVGRSLDRSPLFQVLFTLQNTAQRELVLPGLKVAPMPYAASTTKYDLELTVWEHAGGLRLSWQYATALYEAATIAQLATHFEALLSAALATPTAPAYGLPLLGDADWSRWQAWNRTTKAYPRASTVHALFEAQARRTPDALAVTDGERSWNYATLEARANRVAHALRTRGVGPGSVVGLHVARSLEQVLGVLAILKAGAAYLPLEPEHPDGRLAYMCKDSGVSQVLSMQALATREATGRLDTLYLDDEAMLASMPVHAPLVDGLDATHLAYVIYTSGSTGRPKGVLVPHGGVVNYLDHACGYLQAHHRGAVMGTPLSFDATVTTLFTPLLRGKCLMVLPAETGALFAGLARYLFEDEGDWLFKLTPAHLEGLYGSYAASTPAAARRHCLVIGGEQLATATVARWQRDRLPEAVYVNEYGPTETVVGCSVYTVRSPADLDRCSHAVAIGRPIQNTRLYVLDEAGKPLPAGAVGELCIGGDGVTRGYRNLAALTEGRFREHRFGLDGVERLYHSGDLARYGQDGQLEYLGRRDEQVKLRGYRIELGEIEGQLKQDARVLEAAVVMQGEGEARHLVAFVSAPSVTDEATLLADLWQGVRANLAEYMRPVAIEVLASLPLTANGKVDRAALPTLAHAVSDPYRAPVTETECILALLWQELLGRDEPVGLDDNFFRLGGHSLMATRMVVQINDCLGTGLTVRHAFDSSSLHDLAACVDELRVHAAPTAPRLLAKPSMRPAALSYAQQRLWFVDRLSGGSREYNIVLPIAIEGRLDKEALSHALRMIVQRHEVLRTVYRESGEEVLQHVLPVDMLAVKHRDLRSLDADARHAALAGHVAAAANTVFDLANDAPLTAVLLTLDDEHGVLVLTVHHIAADGWSMDVLVEEFAALYGAWVAGHDAVLPALPVQYADFALWQREQAESLAEGLAYWTEQLAASPGLTTLPPDRPRPARVASAGANYRSELSASVLDKAKALCRRHDVTLFMLLESVLALLLGRYSGQHDLVIGTPVAGRLHREVEPLVGCFVNNLALRTRLTTTMSFAELLEATRATVVAGYEWQDVPFDRVVEGLQVGRSLDRSPLFQVLFTLQNTAQRELVLPGLKVAPMPYAASTTKYDLELTVWEHAGGLRLSWQYATALYEAATIAQLATHFEALLSAALATPTAPAYGLPLLGDADWSRWQAWNRTTKAYPRASTVHALFEAQARRTPDALAVTDGERSWNYATLEARANRVAHALRTRGVGPGSVVGLHVARSLEQVLGVLAILKAGAAYLPLEPEHPDGRLAYMCKDSGVSQVLSMQALATREATGRLDTLYLDDEAMLASMPVHAPLVDGLDATHLAYVIYTSGSTGRPKGVLVPHGGVVNYLDHACGYLQAHHRGAVMGTPLSFDATVTTLFTPLLRGKCLMVLPAETGALFAGLARYLFEDEGDWLFKLTPAHLEGLYGSYAASTPAAARRHCLVIGGEQLATATVARWQRDRLPEAVYVNEYGPTETVVGCSVYTVRSPADLDRCSHAVAIGRPIQNTRLYVLDEAGKPLPAGAVGELCIGGDGVTRGYRNLAALTEGRFREHRFGLDGVERLYHSGDLARYGQDGQLEYLGRRDEQVKLRGYRIELGEIEGQLKQDARVLEAAVVMQGEGEARHLVAFVSAPSVTDEATLLADLWQGVRANLAEYMRPVAIEVLASLPLTANGKVDRAALPTLAHAVSDPYRAPVTETECILALLWQELLGRDEPVGLDDNFFRLGGHSLMATRMVFAVNRQWPLDLQLKDVFERQSLSELALQIDVRRMSAMVESTRGATTSADDEEMEW